MRSRPLRAAIAAATIMSLNGCADMPALPMLGGIGEALSGVTAPVMAVLDPVLAPIFPKAEPTPAPLPINRRRRRPLSPEGSAIASGSIGTGSVPVAPALVYATWAERNKRFDRLRTEGMLRLYRGQTADALDAFKQAQALRPQDPQIGRLVAMVQNPRAASPITGMGGMPAGAPAVQAPDPAAAGLPPGISPELLKRAEQFSQQQQQQGAGAAPQGGDQPAGLFP